MGLTIKSKEGTAMLKPKPAKSLPAPKVEDPNQFEDHLGSSPALGSVYATHETGPKDAKVVKVIKDESHVVHKGVMAHPSKVVRIGVDASRTVNLGKFESAKIGVSISLPCVLEDINETYQFGLDWVSSKIEEAVSDSKN